MFITPQDKLEKHLRCLTLGNQTPLQLSSDQVPDPNVHIHEDLAENSFSDNNDGKEYSLHGPPKGLHYPNQAYFQQSNTNQQIQNNLGPSHGIRETRLTSGGQNLSGQSELGQTQKHLHTNQVSFWPQKHASQYYSSTHRSRTALFPMSHLDSYCVQRNSLNQSNPRNSNKDPKHFLNTNKPLFWPQSHKNLSSPQSPQSKSLVFPISPLNSRIGQMGTRSNSNPRTSHQDVQINGIRKANTSNPKQNYVITGQIESQSSNLERLIQDVLPRIGLDSREVAENEAFRIEIEKNCQQAIARYQRDFCSVDVDISDIDLRCFGSMMTGFATKSSDMDLALLFPRVDKVAGLDDAIIPRLLEKILLDLGYGARLLTKTLIPIIKVCQKPTQKLLSDLRDARCDWENNVDDDELQGEAIVGAHQEVNLELCKFQNDHYPIRKGSETNQSISYESMLVTFKQEKSQSLSDYCNTARQFLKKSRGRDISTSCPELSWAEKNILNDVCKAFILGLKSKRLSVALRKLKSNRSLFDDTISFTQQSLEAVFIQAEGEQYSDAWNSRPYPEATELNDVVARAYVQTWRSLQEIDVPITDIPDHVRQLFLACSNLKKIPSLQLMFLEQTHLEGPALYMERTMKIMRSLQPSANSEINDLISIVISHYISGIKSDSVRELLQGSDHTGADLKQVGILHLILQLAFDYEYALEIGLYSGGNHELVKKFVSILKSMKLNRLFLPSDPSTTSLVIKLRSLPDPTKVSPTSTYRYHDPLRFPKANIGVQCDINFSAEYAIHNTHLLRCYSACDHRVRETVLFIKHWAETRGINSTYHGSLSSYGYVLMVLHYLVNIAQPFVCPNLQNVRLDIPKSSKTETSAASLLRDKKIRFWGDERQISELARCNMLNLNREPVGMLVRGFFEYFAERGNGKGFNWSKDVLSLRSIGGILTKQEKGWVGARTVSVTRAVAKPDANIFCTIQTNDKYLEKKTKCPLKIITETRDIRHRYLLAIEDPFELEHNVARTVNHNGIVGIRNEFRRAWKIIRDNKNLDEGRDKLLDSIPIQDGEKSCLEKILKLITCPDS